jgi:hypothetical protein
MITLISTPAYPEPLDPSIISRWLATESPNNFRLLRRDYLVTAMINIGGYFGFTPNPVFTGTVGNVVTVVDTAGNTFVGEITDVSDPAQIMTDILYTEMVSGIAASYVNDNSERPNYYFEGRIIVNGLIYPLTIIASPDSRGYADLDVSGILRIVTSIGKVGDYSQRIMKETTKSGLLFCDN